jgi:hypothetical protein
MAAEWYYTTNKQQMGPVSWEELRQLAGKALLKPEDLVWTEGMGEWTKAARQQGLFQETPAPAEAVRAPRMEIDKAAPPRESTARRRIDQEPDETDADERRGRRKPRKSSGAGLTIGLIIGGVALVVLVLGCGLVSVIAIAFWDGGGIGADRGPRTYQLVLNVNDFNERRFHFNTGQRVTVASATDPVGGRLQPHVSVQVVHRGRAIATVQGNRRDQSINFVAPANDSYTVRVQNLGPGVANSRIDVR